MARETCLRCNVRFNDWFFWPGHGNYCWPCYRKTGLIITPDSKHPLDPSVDSQSLRLRQKGG